MSFSDKDKIDLKSLLPDELESFILSLDQPKFRAKQIFKWLHGGAESFNEMTNIPAALREKLDECAFITRPKAVSVQRSADGTVKYLREFRGGAMAESVLMRYHHGNTVCVSSQAGCRMGCAFCASTLNGLDRCLSASEILDQVMFMEKDENAKISNIVLMGTGEPLDNFDNVLKFLTLVKDENGLCIGHRHISLSTCGLADKILRLAEYKLQITLSVSLHAPFDDLRSQIMPVNKAFPIDVLISACRRYFGMTGRRISFEYALIDHFNDTESCAEKLSKLISGMAAHVNLIPLNKVSESGLSGSSPERVRAFQNYLLSRGVNATVRRRLGSDIDASCGQLRNRALKYKKV